MKIIFNKSIFLVFAASILMQVLTYYYPQMNAECYKIGESEQIEETDQAETKTEKGNTKNEKEVMEYDWFHSSHTLQIGLNSSLQICSRFFFNYDSVFIPLDTQPPELLS